MSFPRYPAYKATDMDWLGEVPDHWTVNRLKLAVDSCTNGVWGDEAKSDKNDVICIRVADFDRQSLAASKPDEPTIRNVSDRDIEQRSLRNGDLLIEKSGGGEKQPVGAVVLYTGVAPAVCSNFVARMRLKKDQIPSFWKYVHHAAYSVRLNTKSIKQTSGIQNLDQQQYLNEIAAYPPLKEQLSIANFLDRETAKIDALIDEQERLIELLQEKRQAVISHAVTKGLNPDAPMKESGVEWLGEVPEHWEIKPLKHLCDLLRDGTHLPPKRSTEGIPLLSVRNIQESKFTKREDDSLISTEDYRELCRSFTPLPGDTLLAIVGATMGKTAVIDNEIGLFHIQRSLAIFRGLSKYIEKMWLHFVFQSSNFQELLWRDVAFSAQPGIYLGALKDFRIPVPPLSEQKEILKAIQMTDESIKKLTNTAQNAVCLQQERRIALISAAVTGQIDVRGHAQEQEVAL